MKVNTYIFSLFAATLLAWSMVSSPAAVAYDVGWDGNHPAAQSEAWTWMGHLSEIEQKNGQPSLGANGVGFIFYYTRSAEKTLGTMTYRSSALTTTKNFVGTSFKTDTVYAAKSPNGQLRARQGSLDLVFKAGVVDDRAVTMQMTDEDDATLKETLKLFPHLEIARGFRPTKTIYHEVERDGTIVDLVFYSIWPVLSAPNGQMRFLGQDGTYTYSEPMLVTVGTFGGKPVAGLSFLDRQWAMASFGEFVMNGMKSLLQYGQALNYAHSWSAFHAQNKRTGEWSFFHLWHQWYRQPDFSDALDDYSGMLYMRGNGSVSALVPSNEYIWKSSGFVLQKGRQIMMDYSKGRDGFFTSRAEVSAPTLGLNYTMYATPALQNLNQPIPFYEGFGSGEGTWGGDPIVIQGRLESSRLLFRDQDYKEMLETLQATDPAWAQADVQAFLKKKLASSPKNWIDRQWSVLSALLGVMDLKLAILADVITGTKATVDPADPQVTVYF